MQFFSARDGGMSDLIGRAFAAGKYYRSTGSKPWPPSPKSADLNCILGTARPMTPSSQGDWSLIWILRRM